MFCFKVWSWTQDNQLADLTIRALTVNAALTVEVGRDGVPCQEAADRNLIDDVEQQEGHTGEAEGLQQTPCVAWRRRKRRKRRRAVSSTLTLRIGTSGWLDSSSVVLLVLPPLNKKYFIQSWNHINCQLQFQLLQNLNASTASYKGKTPVYGWVAVEKRTEQQTWVVHTICLSSVGLSLFKITHCTGLLLNWHWEKKIPKDHLYYENKLCSPIWASLCSSELKSYQTSVRCLNHINKS